MQKKKKTKATTRNAAKPSLAGQSATPAPDPQISAGNSGHAVTASDAMSPPAPPSETDKVGAPSNVSSASQQPLAIRQIDATLGQIVTIFMRSPQHKQRPMADLEWLVSPAVTRGQFCIVQAQQAGNAVPVGVALWASVSTTVDQRLSDLSVPWRLQPDEWCSGDIPWLVELIADTQTQQTLLKYIGETVFKGRGIKVRVRDADGKMQIGTFKGAG